MQHQNRQFILQDPLNRVMWKLALPAIAAMVLFGLNAFMDTVYIGQLMNETALAGVGLAYPLTSILFGLGSWAGTGAANLLSIVLGNNDEEQQKRIIPNTTLFLLFIAVIFAVPAYIWAESLVRMMGGSGEVLAQGVRYFKITLLAAPLWVFGLALNFIVRGEGKMKTAAIMMTFGLFPNLVLTPIFISYFDMGVAGAAWATNIGMLIYSVTGVLYFTRKKASFTSNITSLAYHKETFAKIAQMGFPGFIMSVMGLVQAVVVLNAIVNNGTENDLVFFAAANRIQLFLMTPLFGLMRALQPVAGINFGAENFERVKHSFLIFTKTGFFIIAPFWLLISLFPEASISLVLPDMVFSAKDLLNLRIYMLVLPMLPFVFMALTFVPAVNEEKYASIIGLSRQLVFYVPVMLIMPKLFGVHWVYLGSTIIDFIITLWLLLLLRKLFAKLS